MKRALGVAGGLSLVLASFAAAGQEATGVAPTPPSAEVKQLMERLDRDEAELTRLREALKPFSSTICPLGTPASPTVGPDVKLWGFVQADSVLYNQASVDEVNPSTGAPLNQTRFLIRRAHLRTDVSYGLVGGALELEGSTVNDPILRIFDAELSVRWPSAQPGALPYLMGTLGLYRIPFGFENPQRDFDRLFLERSAVIRAFFPGENDLGVGLSGGWRGLRYQLSLMNGDPIGEAQFPWRDPNAAKDLVGRLGVDTTLTSKVSVRAGFSGLTGYGFHKGTPATKDTLVWRDTNEDGLVQITEIQVIPGQTATASQNFRRFALGGDVQLSAQVPVLGELMVYGELVWASNLDRALAPADPVATGRDLRELGWYVGFTQELTEHVLFGVRYDRYDPDADAQRRQGLNIVPTSSAFSTLAACAAWRYGRLLRLTLEYDHNTNALGIAPGGLPTTLGSDVLTLRGQVKF